MNNAKILKIHGKLSTLILVLCLIWIVSGFLHPFMGWFRPGAANFRPPASQLTQRPIEIQRIITKYDLRGIGGGRLMVWGKKNVYQIKLKGRLLYYDALSGEEIEDGDVKYAEFLARYYGAEQGAVGPVELVTQFNYQYPFVNRLLPVQKVHFKETGRDYYIHTESDRLGTIGCTSKDVMSLFFKLFHNLSLLDVFPRFKLLVVTLAMGLIAFTACTGLYLYFKLKNKRKRIRKWHVRSGLFSSVIIFLMTFSGLFHIWVKTINMPGRAVIKKSHYDPSQWNISLSDFAVKAAELSLAKLKGKDYLRVKNFDFKAKQTLINYFPMDGSGVLISEVNFARGLASEMSGKDASEIKSLELITRFSGEYGFVNKRLPVWKVTFNKTPLSLYIETRSQKESLRVNTLKRVEGFSFAYLHKAHYLDFLGKNGRNIVLMLFCVIVGFLAITGVKMKSRVR